MISLKNWMSRHSQSDSPSLSRFADHLTSDISSTVELMLCLIRGSDQHKHSYSPKPQPISDLTLRAFNSNAPFPVEQNYLSLATFAMFRLVIDNGLKAGLSRQELDAQVATIVEQVPAVMLHRAMDVQYSRWLAQQSDEDSEHTSARRPGKQDKADADELQSSS